MTLVLYKKALLLSRHNSQSVFSKFYQKHVNQLMVDDLYQEGASQGGMEKTTMRKKHALWVLGALVIVAGLWAVAGHPNALAQDTAGEGVDHSAFGQLQGPFETGPEVTAACLSCHVTAAQEVMATTHWTWEYENLDTGELLGKQHVVNNFCVSVQGNEPRCTSCHTGYGWEDDTFDFTVEQNVDCLVCHDTTGTYKKFPTGAGHPVYDEPKDFGGVTWEPVDLALVAQNVGKTSRETCGSCHFNGGGGDAVKHGDLDTSLLNASYDLDVHMDAEGLNFSCSTCHVTERHEIPGSRYMMDTSEGTPGTCQSCHGLEPHESNAILNTHIEQIACQTCHIPEFARDHPTKMTWDWSTSGEKNPEGGLLIKTNEDGEVVYDTRKGDFTWEQDVVPEYLWFNGTVDYNLVGDEIDPEAGVVINEIEGSKDDPDARIWPFKEFTGVQPYDSGNNTIVAVHLFSKNPDDPTAYWLNYDWDAAITQGMETWGADYSGEYDWVTTEMYWPITHMVAPAEDALSCTDCHTADGRLDFIALGYSEEEAATLSSIPPMTVAPLPTEEAEEKPAEEVAQVEEEVAEETEESAAQLEEMAAMAATAAAQAQEAASTAEESAESAANISRMSTVWTILAVAALLVVAAVAFYIVQKRS